MNGNVKLDAKATTQAAVSEVLDPATKDKPADPSNATDDTATPSPNAGQPAAIANAVVALLTPVATPLALAPAKPAANDAVAITADGAPRPQQAIATPLQVAATEITGNSQAPDNTAAPAGAKPQADTVDIGKPADSKASAGATDQYAPADAQAPAARAPVETAKAADTSAPTPAVLPAQNPAPAPAAAPPSPAPQPLLMPQAAAIPVAGVALEIAGRPSPARTLEIRLDPPELGRIEVRLDVDKDGRITSHVIADSRDTLDLLQRHASGLQRALQNAGLKTSDNGLQFSLRDQTAGQQQQ